MNYQLLHIYRNTPFGRETFLQSVYFCKMTHCHPVVYIPESDKFLMYFSNEAVQVDLDGSYLTSPDTAMKRTEKILKNEGFKPKYYIPKNFTASTLPDISTRFDYLCCPRSISDITSKISLGHLGPKVRRIIKQASFPVLIPSPVFKEWKSISIFFGGSENAMNALKLGLKLAMASGVPLEIYTLLENNYTEADYRDLVTKKELNEPVDQLADKWHFYPENTFDEMLFDVPHDALITLGAYGHGIIKDVIFGSKMEKIQTTVYNNLLVIGPDCSNNLP